MGGQRFFASPHDTMTWPNGAVGYRPGGPFDCLGPFAKVKNCPIGNTDLRRTCYAVGYADTHFSVPATTSIFGVKVNGYLTTDENGCKFIPVRY